jgi:hypothetical protein
MANARFLATPDPRKKILEGIRNLLECLGLIPLMVFENARYSSSSTRFDMCRRRP